MIFQLIQYGIGIAFVTAAVIRDIKEYKIKNKSVLVCIALGITLSFFPQSPCSPLQSVLGILVPLVLFPLFALRMLGAGDIKAFCALGAVFGAFEVLKIMAASFICGGIIALGFMFFRSNGAARVKNFFCYIKSCFMMRQIVSYDGIAQKDAVFRFAYAIAAGLIVYILFCLNGLRL